MVLTGLVVKLFHGRKRRPQKGGAALINVWKLVGAQPNLEQFVAPNEFVGANARKTLGRFRSISGGSAKRSRGGKV
jgi:hypothetical protein